MEITAYSVGKLQIAHVHAIYNLLATAEDATDLIGNMYYQGYDVVMLDAVNIAPDFFDLKTKIAGDILQKFTNYRMRVVFIGNWEEVSSKSLSDFIRESNMGKHVHFVHNLEEALERLLK